MAALLDSFKAEFFFHRALEKGGDHDRALRFLEKAHTLNSSHHGIALSLGHFRFLAGDMKGAMEALAQAESLRPASHVSAQYQGIIHLFLKESHEATGCFDRALSLSSANQLNRNYRSLCSILNGDFAGGTAELQKDGIYSNPRFAGLLMTALEEALLAKERCQAPASPLPGQSGDGEDARPVVTESDEAGSLPGAGTPGTETPAGDGGPVNETASPPQPADPLVVRLLVYPCCAFSYWFLGQHYLNREKFLPASRCFRKVLHYAPATQRIYYHLGEALFYDKAYDEAFEHFSMSLKTDGETPEVLYYLGRLLQMRGRLDEAADRLSLSLEKFAKSPEVLLSLGQIALAKGERDLACRHFTLAADYDFTYILERIREIEKEMGEKSRENAT